MKCRACCVAICVLGGLTVGSLAAPNPQSRTDQNIAASSNTAENNPNSPDTPVVDKAARWLGLFGNDDLTAFSTAIIGVFTIVLGIGTVFLIADGRKHSRHALRAYVFVDAVVAGDQGRAALGVTDNKVSAIAMYGYPAAFWIIKNTGQTPAYQVVHWGQVAVIKVADEESLAEQIPRKIGRVSVSTIPPNGSFTKTVYIPDRLTPEDVIGISDGTKAIYVFGRIQYKDAFRRQRFTNYRLRYTGKYPPTPEMTLTFCDHGNYTDESSDDD